MEDKYFLSFVRLLWCFAGVWLAVQFIGCGGSSLGSISLFADDKDKHENSDDTGCVIGQASPNPWTIQKCYEMGQGFYRKFLLSKNLGLAKVNLQNASSYYSEACQKITDTGCLKGKEVRSLLRTLSGWGTVDDVECKKANGYNCLIKLQNAAMCMRKTNTHDLCIRSIGKIVAVENSNTNDVSGPPQTNYTNTNQKYQAFRESSSLSIAEKLLLELVADYKAECSNGNQYSCDNVPKVEPLLVFFNDSNKLLCNGIEKECLWEIQGAARCLSIEPGSDICINHALATIPSHKDLASKPPESKESKIISYDALLTQKQKNYPVSEPMSNATLCKYIHEYSQSKEGMPKIVAVCDKEEKKSWSNKKRVIKKQLEKACITGNPHGCHLLGFAYQQTIGKKHGGFSGWEDKEFDILMTSISYYENGCDLRLWDACYSACWAYQDLECYYFEKKRDANGNGDYGKTYSFQKKEDAANSAAITAASRGCDIQQTEGTLPGGAANCVILDQIRRKGSTCRRSQYTLKDFIY